MCERESEREGDGKEKREGERATERDKDRERSEILVGQCQASTQSSHVSFASVELPQATGQELFHMKVFQMLSEPVYIFCYGLRALLLCFSLQIIFILPKPPILYLHTKSYSS